MAGLRCWRSPGLLIRSPGRSRSSSRWRRPTCCSLTVRFVAGGARCSAWSRRTCRGRGRRGGGLTWQRSRSEVAGPTGGGRDRCGRPAGRLCRARGRQRVRTGRGTRRSRAPAARAEPAARQQPTALTLARNAAIRPGERVLVTGAARRAGHPAGPVGDRGGRPCRGRGPRRAQAGTAPEPGSRGGRLQRTGLDTDRAAGNRGRRT